MRFRATDDPQHHVQGTPLVGRIRGGCGLQELQRVATLAAENTRPSGPETRSLIIGSKLLANGRQQVYTCELTSGTQGSGSQCWISIDDRGIERSLGIHAMHRACRNP